MITRILLHDWVCLLLIGAYGLMMLSMAFWWDGWVSLLLR
jgi:hypothetical protein